jgi:hypothetical protein
MGLLYDRAHGINQKPPYPDLQRREGTIPIYPEQRLGYCARHGRQVARLKGREICWPCHVEVYAKIVRKREAGDAQGKPEEAPRDVGSVPEQHGQ